jgi:hypothetical protein
LGANSKIQGRIRIRQFEWKRGRDAKAHVPAVDGGISSDARDSGENRAIRKVSCSWAVGNTGEAR